MPMVFAFYGVESVQDVVTSGFEYLVGMILGFLAVEVDMSKNLIAQFIGGKIVVSTCTATPEKCGITCARYPDLKVSG